MTQEELANAAGLSTPCIRRLEQGVGDVRMETLRAIANVLGVRTVWFAVPGSPAPRPDEGDDIVLAELRSTILPPVGLNGTLFLDTVDTEEVSLPRLRSAVNGVAALYHSGSYNELAEVLPGMIRSAHHNVRYFNAGIEHRDARLIRGDLLCIAGRYLIQVRRHDLALSALQQSVTDAVAADDIDLAATAVSCQAHAMLRQARFGEVIRLCLETAIQIEPKLSEATNERLSAWGRLMLRASAAAMRNNQPDDAEEYLRQAKAAGARIGREVDGAGHTRFGPLTAGLLEPENEQIQGRPDRTIAALRDLPRGVGSTSPSTWNRAQLDKASALVQLRRYDEATAVMKKLRRAHAKWLQQQRYGADIAREIVQGRTRTPNADQIELANWFGVGD